MKSISYNSKQDLTNTSGHVYWITGLSAAGKTTLARLLANEFKKENADNLVLLDGDELRKIMGVEGKYSRGDRLKIALTYSRLCCFLSSQGLDVIIATISMFNEVHSWNRANILDYTEIFLDVSQNELVKRDTKGIYKENISSNSTDNVAGVDIKVDVPQNPDVHIKWHGGLSPDDTLKIVLHALKKKEKT